MALQDWWVSVSHGSPRHSKKSQARQQLVSRGKTAMVANIRTGAFSSCVGCGATAAGIDTLTSETLARIR